MPQTSTGIGRIAAFLYGIIWPEDYKILVVKRYPVTFSDRNTNKYRSCVEGNAVLFLITGTS
jgi:hypothetical protein